jgi:signal transduction histidine kinase
MRASQHPEAAFLAAMTASATHEVRNVLAIIKESAGLVGDMAHASGERGVMDREKVFRALDRIETQVKRGADLLTNLNRLSHTLDHDLSTVDLGEEVEQMLFRGQRFARKRGQQVAAGNRTNECTLTVNPLHLHMVLFAALERCLETMPEGSTVTVEVHQDPGARRVEYGGASVEGQEVALHLGTEGLADLEKLAGPLGATVERCEPGYGIRILFPHGTVA